VHQLVLAHGDLYSDLKKANVYYLLDRLAREGFVSVKTEQGARGPRGERLVYSLTRAGRQEMASLLRSELERYEPAHSGIEVAMVLLGQLPKAEARHLLERRLEKVEAARAELVEQLGRAALRPGSAAEHMLMLANAERRWLKRAVRSTGGRGHAGTRT
jgi:DNA-binding PadR family transcriptional regulator